MWVIEVVEWCRYSHLRGSRDDPKGPGESKRIELSGRDEEFLDLPMNALIAILQVGLFLFLIT